MKTNFLILATLFFLSILTSCNQEPQYTPLSGDETLVKVLDNKTGRVLIIVGGSEQAFEYDLKSNEYFRRTFKLVDSLNK
jgi:hypothetical protein